MSDPFSVAEKLATLVAGRVMTTGAGVAVAVGVGVWVGVGVGEPAGILRLYFWMESAAAETPTITGLSDGFPGPVAFRSASANGIAHTAIRRSR